MEKVLIDIREENNQIRCLFKLKDFVSVDEILDKLCELDDERAYAEEKVEDLEQDIEENYIPIRVDDEI